MEVSVDPNKDISKDDPIILSQHNISKAIKDSILINFGECGLASSLGSLQGIYMRGEGIKFQMCSKSKI